MVARCSWQCEGLLAARTRAQKRRSLAVAVRSLSQILRRQTPLTNSYLATRRLDENRRVACLKRVKVADEVNVINLLSFSDWTVQTSGQCDTHTNWSHR